MFDAHYGDSSALATLGKLARTGAILHVVAAEKLRGIQHVAGYTAEFNLLLSELISAGARFSKPLSIIDIIRILPGQPPKLSKKIKPKGATGKPSINSADSLLSPNVTTFGHDDISNESSYLAASESVKELMGDPSRPQQSSRQPYSLNPPTSAGATVIDPDIFGHPLT